jgi:hypothetical protein
VIDILGRQRRFDPGQAKGFEFEHRHGAGGILQQGVIDTNADLFARDERPLDQMGGENLMS